MVRVGKAVGSIRINSINFKGSDAIPFDGNGIVELEIERLKKGFAGSPVVKRQIPVKVVPDSGGTKLAKCYAVSVNASNSIALCRMIGGYYNPDTERCDRVAEELVDSSSIATCGAGSRYRLTVVNGKISIVCEPCTQQKQFSRYECGQPFLGKGYVNMCYYKTVCREDPNALIEP